MFLHCRNNLIFGNNLKIVLRIPIFYFHCVPSMNKTIMTVDIRLIDLKSIIISALWLVFFKSNYAASIYLTFQKKKCIEWTNINFSLTSTKKKKKR